MFIKIFKMLDDRSHLLVKYYERLSYYLYFLNPIEAMITPKHHLYFSPFLNIH